MIQLKNQAQLETTATNAYAVEELILLHQFAYILEIGHGALVPIAVVCFVKRSD